MRFISTVSFQNAAGMKPKLKVEENLFDKGMSTEHS